MANPEHLALINQGVEALNLFSLKHPEVALDLHGANLRGANLIEANLRGANLRGANLIEANLRGANLIEANLRGANLHGANLLIANLTGANLTGANLRGAGLTGANLIEANLTLADLRGANLNQANLHGADFSESNLHMTVFADVNLGEAVNLEMCIHYGPSSLDTHTLFKSGPLPDAFLRGCGLPDNLIEYLPSLTGTAFQYYSCFISYSSKDEDFAKRLHADLQANAVRCWFAPEDMKIGDRIRYAIDEAIRLRDKLLLVLSQAAIESGWVETEVETALEEERERGTTVLFPVRVDRAVMETSRPWARQIRNTRHIGDFCAWKNNEAYQKAFDRLLLDIAKTDET